MLKLRTQGKSSQFPKSNLFYLSRKGVSTLLAVVLFLLVTVILIGFFQLWNYDFTTSLSSEVETRVVEGSTDVQIETVSGGILYLQNEFDNLTVSKITFDGKDCGITDSFSEGTAQVNLGSCTTGTTGKAVDVVVVTNKGIFSNQINYRDVDVIKTYASCTLSGVTRYHGETNYFYNDTTVPYGDSCSSVVRNCNNGVFEGDSSYIYSSCSVIGQDITPDLFSFTNLSGNVSLSTLTTSETLTPTGYEGPLSVSILGDGSPQLSINDGAWTTSGSMNLGDNLTIRLTSSSFSSTTHSAVLTLGDYSTIWDVTTMNLVGSCSWNFGMDTSLADVNASFIGETSVSYAGDSVSDVGDVNGDGYGDFIIGATTNSEGGADAGQVYLFFGKSSGWNMNTNLSTADASFIGENSGDQVGEKVGGVGDVNGDGFDDFVVGSRWNDEGAYAAGQVYLILGRANGWQMDINLSQANASFIGEYSTDFVELGRGIGDINNDGFDDFAVGSNSNSEAANYAGQVYILFGRASGWQMDIDLSLANASFLGEEEGDSAGTSVSGTGDINGDGIDDFLIGASESSLGNSTKGKTYVIFGRLSGWQMDANLSTADASFMGESSDDYSGIEVSGIGDFNGDGFNDFVIGSQSNEGGADAGQAYLIFGKSSGWSMNINLSTADASFIGENSVDLFSDGAISGVGDVNNDSFDDFIVSANFNDESANNAGQSYLILGRSSGWSMDTNVANVNASFLGESLEDYSGSSISGAGDVNGDGCYDFLIGAHRNDEGGVDAGQAYLILGG